MKVKDKASFIEAWNSHIDDLYSLAYSLPPEKVCEFDAKLKGLKQYVKIAGYHVYGVKAHKVCLIEGHDLGDKGTVCMRCGEVVK